jgi:hypothetical protein
MMFDFGVEDICGYPKADKRKNERKGRTKGEIIVAMSTPEMKSIGQKKITERKLLEY